MLNESPGGWGFSPGMLALGMEPPRSEEAKQPLEKPHVCILATAPAQIAANNHHQLARLWLREALDDFSPQPLSKPSWSWMWQQWAIPTGPNNIAYSSANTLVILSRWPLEVVGDIAKDNGTCLYLPDRHKCQRTVTPMAGWDVVKKTVSNQDPCSRRILGAHADEWWNPAGTQPCFPQHR